MRKVYSEVGTYAVEINAIRQCAGLPSHPSIVCDAVFGPYPSARQVADFEGISSAVGQMAQIKDHEGGERVGRHGHARCRRGGFRRCGIVRRAVAQAVGGKGYERVIDPPLRWWSACDMASAEVLVAGSTSSCCFMIIGFG